MSQEYNAMSTLTGGRHLVCLRREAESWAKNPDTKKARQTGITQKANAWGFPRANEQKKSYLAACL